MPVMPGGKGPNTPLEGGKEKELPEYCLVRVVDVDIAPRPHLRVPPEGPHGQPQLQAPRHGLAVYGRSRSWKRASGRRRRSS